MVYVWAIAGAVGFLIFLSNRFFPKPPIVSIPAVLPEAPQAAKVEKIYIPGPIRWRVYKKEELIEKVPLSETVKSNPQVQVVATAAVPPSPYGGTAAAFGNVSTGVFGIDYTPKERPLFGLGGKTGIGILGGVSTKGNVAMGYLGQDVLRIGPVNLGVAGGGGVIGTDGILGAVINIHGEF